MVICKTLTANTVPKIRRKAKVIAIPKPGKYLGPDSQKILRQT